MKSLKSASLIAMMLLLAACGGHGFEGDYKSEADSSIELVDAFTEIAGSYTLVIGSNYIESEGERTTFDDIFVRESAGERYLVFKSAEKEDNH